MPNPVELNPGRKRRLWQVAGAGAACAGVALSGLDWPGQLLALLAIGVCLWRAVRAPRAVRLVPDGEQWRVRFDDGVERLARPGTARGLWPGALTLRCGARRLLIFADECSTADFRRLKRQLLGR